MMVGALVAMAIGLAACGTATRRDSLVAQVGHQVITGDLLRHWMAVLAPRHIVPAPPHFDECVAALLAQGDGSEGEDLRICRELYVSLKREALGYLISTAWLLQEANQEGNPVSHDETSRLLARRQSSEGVAEFTTALRLTDRAVADVELEIERELAQEHLRSHVLHELPQVSNAEEKAFYRAHPARFSHRERRDFYLVEYLKSASEARTLIREFAAGKRKLEAPGTSLQESLERPRNLGSARTIVKAIFGAKPGVVTGPVRIEQRFYFIIKVARVVRPSSRSLGQVRWQIRRLIEHERERRSLLSFAAEWRRRWLLQTRCQAAAVEPGCREFRGDAVPTGSRIFE